MNHSLGPWIDYFKIFVSGHNAEGAVPPSNILPRYWIEFGLCIALVLVILVLMLPFVFRSLLVTAPQVAARSGPADQLVIITPHLETVRRKFDRAFAAWYAGKYHRGVNIEYLSFGGGEV